MKAFYRYLICISLRVLPLCGIIVLVAEPRLPTKIVLIDLLLVIVGFIIPMAAFSASQVSRTVRYFPGDPDTVAEKLEGMILKEHRECAEKNDTRTVYAYSAGNTLLFGWEWRKRYLRWVAEDVLVTKEENMVVVEGPQWLLNKLKL